MLRRRKSPKTPRFRRPRRNGSRLRKWWVPISLLIVLAAWQYAVRPVIEEQGWTRVSDRFALCGDREDRSQGCVVDGDSLLIGYGADKRRIRLTGYDAPELSGACEAEQKQALRARDALRDWLAQGAFEWSGEADPPRDKYGRELREVSRVTRGGKREYLADAMIERGLAAESGWGTWPKDWCA